jgi:hypothetical protein
MLICMHVTGFYPQIELFIRPLITTQADRQTDKPCTAFVARLSVLRVR